MSISTLTSKGQTTIPAVTELKRLLSKPKKRISIEEMKRIIKKRGAKHARN